MAEQTPLEGLRVLELTGWNGVVAGRLLADGGADVVRVVPPAGDPLDAEPPFFGSSGVSIQATWYNAGKRILTVDTGTGAGRGQLLGLVASAEVLIEDWAPGNGPLTEAELTAANPRLARVSVTPFGQNGPWTAFRANDLVQNALSGSASVTGEADTPPLTGYGNQTYHTVGMYAAVCALAALRAARATGEAQHVDLSAYEAAISCTEQVLMEWFFPISGNWPEPIAARQGSLHWSGAYAVYPGSNGRGMMITAALRFADILLPWLIEEGAAQDLADSEKYPDIIAMIRNLPYVMRVLREWVATKDPDELFYEAQARHQSWGPVWDIAKVLESPQIAAREYLQPVAVPGVGVVAFPGRMFVTSADGPRTSPPAPISLPQLGWEERPPESPEGGPATPGAPLAGIRVLDFTHVLAGPFGTRVLGDLGADVIKVGTATRGAGANSQAHPYYTMWNRNKRSILLNMATPGGRDIAGRLAAQCDVIIENFSAGVLKRWGLDRAGMAAANPALTVISMGGMGQSGPWKDFVTFAPTIHAVTGLTHLTNFPGRTGDIGYGFSLTDHLSGLVGAVAALEALEYRRRTGQGLEIDLSQYEMGLGLMAPALIDCLANGVNPAPAGNRHPYNAWAPHGIYRCTGDDAWIAIAAREDREWVALCGVMGRPDLAGDPRFASHAARVANQDALDALIEDWTRTRDRYDAMAACQAAGVMAGAVQNAEDLTRRVPQNVHRRFFGLLPSSAWGDYPAEAFPATFNGRRPAVGEGVHDAGADTFDVLTGILGLSDDEVAELAESGALS